jgi:para-nitrobenzyl esterase
MADEFLGLFPLVRMRRLSVHKIADITGLRLAELLLASLQKDRQKQSHLYYFTRVPPGLPSYGAFHSAEFGYALKTLKLWDRPFTPWDHQLSEIMSSYWVNFAANGNPNGKGLPEWDAFESRNPQVMEFGDKTQAISLPFRSQLNFFDRYQTETD